LDQVRKHLLTCCIVALSFALAFAGSDQPLRPAVQARHFFPDDPLWRMPPPLPVKQPHKRKIDQLYDFVINSVATPGEHKIPEEAQGVNTLGEVPDSTWYTNRHYWHRMSLEELRRGPAITGGPIAPYHVVSGKSEGVTPGFQMLDAKGRRYFCKADPFSNPEMATAADVIGSKFFYAFGYNVPENYIAFIGTDEISLDPKAHMTGINGKDRPMNAEDLRRILALVPREREGRYRVLASLAIAGEGIGPFRWYGTRRDDPDDIYPHEHRRDLRGLFVFASWVNHTDVKANNTYDSVVEWRGVKAILHHLIDFGASLGSDSDAAKDARFGHEYMIEKDAKVLLKMGSLGLYSPAWERADFPHIPAVGNFEAETFQPDTWTSNYPNAAFINRLPDDTFWGAKQVMSFTDAEIRAMVETGQFSDRRAVDYLTATLVKRRDKIGRYCFGQVLPLDRFEVRGGELRFEDLGAKYNFFPARAYQVQWFRFNNQTGQISPLAAAAGFVVPRSAAGDYAVAEIQTPSAAGKLVRVYLRGEQVVGIDRTW
jgi:hypothetical protein